MLELQLGEGFGPLPDLVLVPGHLGEEPLLGGPQRRHSGTYFLLKEAHGEISGLQWRAGRLLFTERSHGGASQGEPRWSYGNVKK